MTQARTKRQRVKSGDIVAVPFADDLVAVGIILHVSKRFANGVMMGFYNQSFQSIEAIDTQKIGGTFLWTPNYTGKWAITDGLWRVIGNSPELLEETTIPTLCVANNLYYKDEFIRQIPLLEAEKYPGLLASGGGAIENRLRRYFMQQTTD